MSERFWPKAPLLMLFFVLSFVLAACQQQVATATPEVISVRPHDPEAFTQGLLFYNGLLYESTGLFDGRSSLREVNPQTGEVIRMLNLGNEYFGEGLARVDSQLFQLTWRNGRAFVYDLESFNSTGRFSYAGEGWGLCYDGNALFMSDGSATIFRRSPDSFEVDKEIKVSLRGKALNMLNELECVDNYIYANIWQTDTIVKIDKSSGRVLSEIDAAGLLSPEERASLSPDAVLNGIAYNPQSDSFFITGKLWPKLFEVRFVEN